MSLYTTFDHYNVPLGDDGTPTEFFKALRDEALETDTPVGWSQEYGGFWVVAGYEEARQIYHNADIFTNQETVFPRYMLPNDSKLMLSEMDEPVHKKYRSIVSGPFSPRNAERIAEPLRAAANELIDRFAGEGRVEVCNAFTNQVPGVFAAIILGSPAEDGHRFRDWTHAMAHGHRTDNQEALAHIRELDAYFERMLEERRTNPGDDVLSLVIGSEVDGERLTDQEIKDFWVVLLLAGIDNTARLLGTILWRLAWDTELRTRCIAEPELVPFVFDEFMRFHTPALSAKVVGKHGTVGGVDVEPGQHMILALPSINRDPRQFEDPDRFIADRSPNRHIGLGLGIHRCLGAHLLRVEARIVMQEFLRRIPEFGLDPDRQTDWLQGQVCGMQQVPLVFPFADARAQSSSHPATRAA
jgi:cytochrome P450